MPGMYNTSDIFKPSCAKLDSYNWLKDIQIADKTASSVFVEVRFKNSKKEFFKAFQSMNLEDGDFVAVESSPGHDIGIVSLTATLFGHIVGDIMFEAIYWPNIISSVDAWKSTWQLLAWVYPLERVMITIAAALIGTVLIKALKAYGLKL